MSRRSWIGNRVGTAWGLLAVLGSGLIGCGPSEPPGAAYVTPSALAKSAKAAPTLSPSPTRKAVEVACILPISQDYDISVWRQVARLEVGRLKGVYNEIQATAEKDQAACVREAIKQGASAVVVIPARAPADDAPLIAALAEARDKKVPVVLAGRSLETSDGVKFPHVLPGLPDEMARKLVEAALEDAKTFEIPAGSTALLLQGDETNSEDRAQAFRKAITEAKIPLAGEVRYPMGTVEAHARIKAALDRDPKIGFLFATDNDGLNAGTSVAMPSTPGAPPPRNLAIAAFTNLDGSKYIAESGQASGLAHLHTTDIAVQAVRLAFRAIQGETIPETTHVSITFQRGSGQRFIVRPAPSGPPGRQD